MTLRPRVFGSRPLALFVLATAIVVISAPNAMAAKKGRSAQAQVCTGNDARPLEVGPTEVRTTTLCLLNAERRDRGLPALRLNDKLGFSATRHSRQMVANQFFSHVSPGGGTLTLRVRKTAYLSGASSWSIGENIAWGAGGRANPRAIVDAWMNSAGHRANILSRQFRDIGIGIAFGTPRGLDDGATYTTDFGRRG